MRFNYQLLMFRSLRIFMIAKIWLIGLESVCVLPDFFFFPPKPLQIPYALFIKSVRFNGHILINGSSSLLTVQKPLLSHVTVVCSSDESTCFVSSCGFVAYHRLRNRCYLSSVCVCNITDVSSLIDVSSNYYRLLL